MLRLKTLFCLALIVKLNLSQYSGSNCKSKETCSECIQEVGCLWCVNPKAEIYCVHEKEVDTNWCESGSIINPKDDFEILQNSPLTSTKDEAVQISPQRVKISMRRGHEFNLTFQYAQAKNYPVDLYYIMDLSASMEDHRDKLAKLGSKLARTMMNITNNFRLGFGSFVDKVDLPFVSTVPEKLIRPCKLATRGKNVICVPPYSFKNHLSLTDDSDKFSQEVAKAKVSGNLDAPEGGFDALMQAIVCNDVIGWRRQARHLVVFSTDADFHIAGDGKLAGVVEPNDATCHMTNNVYTHDLKLDYPSVSHINYVAKENNINIVFAIVNKRRVVDVYKKLSESIENSNMGALDERSENVIKLVVENYNKIVDSVTISSNASSDVEVKISSTCSHPKENGCTNIHVGEKVSFTATIKPLECTKGSTRKIISIKPEALNESIIIDLEVLCNCDCESSSSRFHIPKSDKCSKSGTLNCGVCDCDSGFFGKKCECNRLTSQSSGTANCKSNKNDTTVCSGLGICRCGQCQCNKRSKPEEKIFGKYCDCDNYSCKRVDGKLCSLKGTCECGGICNCQAGWAGDACECPDSNNACIKAGSNNLMCNGHGTCTCGKCECFDEQVRYSGQYCDECPTCEGQRCEELRDCVECQVHQKGDCSVNCTEMSIEVVEKVANDQDTDIKTCTLVDDEDCTFVFQYEYLDNKKLNVIAEMKKVCRGPPNVLAWVLGVIGSVLLAGLILLLIWKLCTTVHDRREYAKFENERQKLKWHRNENPLYKEATSTFANPLFRRSKSREEKEK